MMYHYCNLDALIGIFTNKAVWASNYRYLNDHQEIEAAKEVISENLDLIKGQLNSETSSEEIIQNIKQAIGESNDYFITSFSTEPDMLSQWRAYSNNGRGVCVGFDADMFSKIGYHTHKVLYGHKDFVKSIIQISNDHIEKYGFDVTKFSIFRDLITFQIARFKSEAFSEEKERRLIIPSKQENPKFRRSGNFIVPYIDVLFDENPETIVEIWIGPANKDRDTHKSVQYFKDFSGFNKARLRTSYATFRD